MFPGRSPKGIGKREGQILNINNFSRKEGVSLRISIQVRLTQPEVGALEVYNSLGNTRSNYNFLSNNWA
jgi:hypothetical protein